MHVLLFPAGDISSKNGKANPSVLAVFHDYIKVMPMVTEANQMSQELNKVPRKHFALKYSTIKHLGQAAF